MSALESMFTAKPSSLKAEKSKDEKPQDTIDARQEEVSPKFVHDLTIVNKIWCMVVYKIGEGLE